MLLQDNRVINSVWKAMAVDVVWSYLYLKRDRYLSTYWTGRLAICGPRKKGPNHSGALTFIVASHNPSRAPRRLVEIVQEHLI